MVIRSSGKTGVACAAAFWTACAGAVTEVVPSFTIFSSVEDNVRLLEDTSFSDSSKSVVLDAGLAFSVYDERGSLVLEPRVEANAYSDRENSDLEGEDLFLDGRAEYSWETASIGFRIDYRREAIIRAELPDIDDPDFDDDIGVGDPDSVDSGRLTFVDQDRKRLTLRPYVEFDISERSRFRIQTDFTDVSYTGPVDLSRSAFDSRTLRASIVRRPNERNRITATLHVRNYEADVTSNTTDSVGIVGAINRQVTGLWTINLEAGVERSDYRFEDPQQGLVDNASVEYLYGVRARRRNERTQLEFVFDRRPAGSSTGQVVDRNQFRVFLDHAMTQRLSARIALWANRSSTLDAAGRANDRDYLRSELSLRWAMRPKWSIVGGYNYTSQDFTNQDTGARSSGVLYIGFGYQGLSQPGAP